MQPANEANAGAVESNPSEETVARYLVVPEGAQIKRQSFLHSRSSTSPTVRAYSLTRPLLHRSPSRHADLHKGALLVECLNLSIYQHKLLCQTWPKIYSAGPYKMGTAIFSALCASNPAARNLLQKAQVCETFANKSVADPLKDHANWLVELFDAAIRSLDRPVLDLEEKCQEYGLQHRCLRSEGFTNAVWDALSDVLHEYVRKHDAVRKHRELSRAWAALIAFVVERMKQGQCSTTVRRRSFGQELRKHKSFE